MLAYRLVPSRSPNHIDIQPEHLLVSATLIHNGRLKLIQYFCGINIHKMSNMPDIPDMPNMLLAAAVCLHIAVALELVAG